jgi:ankyrin repeat protein
VVASAALVQAAGRGQAEVLRVLLTAAGADLPAEALSGAAEHGEVECVDALLQAGAEVDALESARGLSALHLAVKGGHADAVSLLLSNGADRFALDREGRSVWEIAPEPAAKLVPVEDVEAAPP